LVKQARIESEPVFREQLSLWKQSPSLGSPACTAREVFWNTSFKKNWCFRI